MSSSKSPRKLVKRGPGETEDGRPLSPTERSETRGRSIEILEPIVPLKHDESERELAMRLELAKQNGLSQQAIIAETSSFMLRDPPFAETIYEG